MAIQRMEHVLMVVENMEAVKAFWAGKKERRMSRSL